MKKEIFDKMRDTELSPDEFITLMFERTSEDGVLYIPGWHRDGHGFGWGVLGSTDENDSYRCKIKWGLFDYEKILKRFNKHCEMIEQIAKVIIQANKNDIEPEFKGEMLDFWNKYLKPFDDSAFDMDKINDIDDRLDTLACVRYIASKFSKGEELEENDKGFFKEYFDITVTKEEKEYFYSYNDAIIKECESRVGENICAYRVVIGSRRLCKLLELQAPQIVVRNEACTLAAAFVLHEYGVSREVVDDNVRLRIEEMENMDDDELDELFRPQKMNSRKSLAPLFVYSILKEKSNSKKHLRQQEILNELIKYPYELSIERKALSRIIHNLADSEQYAVYQDKTGVWIEQENKDAK